MWDKSEKGQVMGSPQNTNGLLQTLINQVTDLASKVALKTDIDNLRSELNTGLSKVHDRINGINESCNERLTSCTKLHNRYNSNIDELKKWASESNSEETAKKKKRSDFKSKIYLAVIVATLTILSGVAISQLQKYGIIFAPKP